MLNLNNGPDQASDEIPARYFPGGGGDRRHVTPCPSRSSRPRPRRYSRRGFDNRRDRHISHDRILPMEQASVSGFHSAGTLASAASGSSYSTMIETRGTWRN